jgi:hypothetical protein
MKTMTLAGKRSQPGSEIVPDADWWRGGVIYQVYPRSYQDTSGDGVGDLIGIAERIEYIASLGVDAIWISPFFTSPMKDFGYDVSDYTNVDPMFGTLGDFDHLVKAAHDHGIRIIIDLVLSTRQTSIPGSSKAAWTAPTPRPTGMSGPTQARWHAAQQLAVDLRRLGLAVGRQARAVLPAQFPHLAAGSEFPQSGSSGSPARRGALLA